MALIAALLLGGVATWLTAGWLDRAAANATAGANTLETVRILVAANDLKPGDSIAAGMLHWQLWPQAAVRPEHLVEGASDPQAWAGAMVRMAISAGEPLLAAHLVKRGDQGIMAALIAPGHRAVTIAVTASSGLAGFVGPGDRVDIVLTANIANGGATRIVAQTVVDNARVLGIDQRVDPVNAAALQGGDGFSPPTTITLEVTPKQAQALAVAQELGKLTLTLRDLKAQQASLQSAALGKTWDTDVTQLPEAAFAATAQGLETALLPGGPAAMGSMGQPSAPAALPAAGGAAAGGAVIGGSVAVERVNGVEIVRGSSSRTTADAAPAAAAPAPAAQ